LRATAAEMASPGSHRPANVRSWADSQCGGVISAACCPTVRLVDAEFIRAGASRQAAGPIYNTRHVDIASPTQSRSSRYYRLAVIPTEAVWPVSHRPVCRKVHVLLLAVGRTGHRFCRHGPRPDNCGHRDRKQRAPQHDSFPFGPVLPQIGMAMRRLSNRSITTAL
jgi:hypothetical protein